MNIIQPHIFTIDATKLFNYFSKAQNDTNTYCLDTLNRYYYSKVVNQTSEFEECPLYHQFIYSDTFGKNNVDLTNEKWLIDKLVIIDFGRIFNPVTSNNKGTIRRKEILLDKAKDLMENGLDIKFEKNTVHMVPFDKSGNMSRNSRISFINEDYYEEMNARLNLGMDFSKFNVVLSKYYAYRGLYLSTSQRVEHAKIRITPETLIIMKDNKEEMIGAAFQRNVKYITAKEAKGDNSPASTQSWEFTDEETSEIECVEIPFDGQGFISKDYSNWINEALEIHGANSYQIRLPFVKGMLHQVDVQAFLNEFDPEGMKKTSYIYIDAFGKERDLKKAQIFLTESMFKGFKWLMEHCEKQGIDDPMVFYCDAVNKYRHSLYISGTNLPYGYSLYTHLSYQMLNTLKLTDEQFERIINVHCNFIDNPSEFLKALEDSGASDDVYLESPQIKHSNPSWKSALLSDTEKNFKADSYIKSELTNIQKGLLTKIATGKILVRGQTRYLCRDLLPLLYMLLNKDRIDNDDYYMFLWMKAYVPSGEEGKKQVLEDADTGYYDDIAFFRSPHLSRNEQCVLQPFVLPGKKEEFRPYAAIYKDNEVTGFNVNYKEYKEHLDIYIRFFGHLTGIVMVPRGSIVPLCLGGADFDGDLVNIVFDKDITQAVREVCHGEAWIDRILPVIKIPTITEEPVKLPDSVPFLHVKNTFSNRIGFLSDAAISIGQLEYGSDRSVDFDKKGPTCAKCTILTGLEIDSAKNGKHPNLSIIENAEIPDSDYLSFLHSYRNLKSNYRFAFNDMVIRIQKDSGSGEYLEISAKECKEKPKFIISEKNSQGTMINKLPILFMNNYKKYKAGLKEKSKEDLKLFTLQRYAENKQVGEFAAECNSILDLYFWYKGTFLRHLKSEKNRGGYGAENLSKLIIKTYDDENAAYIREFIVSELVSKLDQKLPSGISKEDIGKRLDLYNWQFQKYDDRGAALEKIIGNGFTVDMLTEDEKSFIYSFKQTGYKMLWHLLSSIIEARCVEYDLIFENVKEKRDELVSEKLFYLDKQFEKIAKEYYQDNLIDPDGKLYDLCINTLRKVVNDCNLSKDIAIQEFYKLTSGKKNADKRKFFWDLFTWEEIEHCLQNEEVR